MQRTPGAGTGADARTGGQYLGGHDNFRDHQEGLGGGDLPGLLTSLDFQSFLNNHLQRLCAQRQILDNEITRVREFLSRAGQAQPAQGQQVSLPSLLLSLTRMPWEDGAPILRQKKDWYFVLRALSERGILHQDAYTRLIQLLKQAQIPASLMPTRALLCNTAGTFGQYKKIVEDWEQRGCSSADFARRKALALAVLRSFEM